MEKEFNKTIDLFDDYVSTFQNISTRKLKLASHLDSIAQKHEIQQSNMASLQQSIGSSGDEAAKPNEKDKNVLSNTTDTASKDEFEEQKK